MSYEWTSHHLNMFNLLLFSCFWLFTVHCGYSIDWLRDTASCQIY